MCGIAGIWRRHGAADDRAVVEAMLARMVRRGPDDQGLVAVDGLTLGHRRLAILDLTPGGRQPMASPSGRFVAAFNGEIYNYVELAAELGIDRARLGSTGDTAVLLAAWDRLGPAVLERCVGQWALAVYDRHERRLWLARDRFGEKPLFWHEASGTLAFASTLGALTCAPEVPRELDEQALGEFVVLRYVVAPRTVLRGVRKLEPGTLLRADAGGVRIERWYEPRFRAPEVTSRGEAVERFGELLVQASRRCLASDVPVALLLSDGIDSQGLRAALALAGSRVPAINFQALPHPDHVPPTESAEGEVHLRVTVTPRERIEHVATALGRLSEPVGDGAALATWMLIRAARPHATVFLCGHGGDELLGGYRLSQDRFRLASFRHIGRLPFAGRDEAFGRYTYGDEDVAARRAAVLAASPATLPAAARYIIHRPLPADAAAALFAATRLPEPYLATIDRLYAECGARASDLDRMQEVMLRTFLAANILSFADAVAMDSSAELRMPFLDRDLAEFVLGLPPSFRVSRWPGHANTKQILRWWGRGRVAPVVLGRKKQTFPYGSIRELLGSDPDAVRGVLLGSSAVRRALPGIERWAAEPPHFFHGPWEGTAWALLALSSWCVESGVA